MPRRWRRARGRGDGEERDRAEELIAAIEAKLAQVIHTAGVFSLHWKLEGGAHSS